VKSTTDMSERLAALNEMNTAQLKAEYVRLFGEPPRSRHRQQLIRRIAWRWQVLADGDISEAARQRADQLADLSWLRLTAPREWEPRPAARQARPRDPRLPPPGTILRRHYQGQTVEVQVRQRGFECQGVNYRSLSAVARAVTGAHWNGYLFFGLTAQGECP